jgi:cytochrome c-type biogenesis protein CcmH
VVGTFSVMKYAVIVWLLAAGMVALASGAASAESRPGAAALESRLYAPCCYGGTLDVHESELARELRKEIDERLARGEAPDSIQADFVQRYGDRVVAARSDRPIAAMGLSLLALLATAGGALGLLMRRWTGRTESGPPRASEPSSRKDGLDARIDAELAEID